MYTVDIQDADGRLGRDTAERLAEVARLVLRSEGAPEGAEVALVIVGDDKIRELNRRYRGVDRPTDVLAFAAGEGEAFPAPPGAPCPLGDLIVSYPMAAAQASERDRSVDDELALLVVHGCLHLLGYDHASEDERERMWARQDALLGAAG